MGSLNVKIDAPARYVLFDISSDTDHHDDLDLLVEVVLTPLDNLRNGHVSPLCERNTLSLTSVIVPFLCAKDVRFH